MEISSSSENSGKVFVIGRNKTGTTSVAEALRTLGYSVGEQAEAELLMEDWAIRRFDRIVEYCRTADAFQDMPFSNDYTYQVLDYAFPGSKFILTVRASAEEWFESLIRFHTKIVRKQRLPTAGDLKAFAYRRPGWVWRNQVLVYGVNESTLYNPTIYMNHYEEHNRRVRNYFRFRKPDLLQLNVADEDAARRLCAFLGKPGTLARLPHLNQSS